MVGTVELCSAGVDDDSASASSTSSLDDVFAAQLSMTPHLPWPDLNSGAVSIAGSPLLRTDIPLCRFQKPKDCTRARRESMDICSSLQSQLILSARRYARDCKPVIIVICSVH